MYQLLELESLKDFSCIGDKCPDNCCHSWKIYINKSTYKKYKKTKGIKTENLVVLNKNNSNKYAEINLKENGNCPFLSDSGLCDIHKNYGKNMLSDVCRIYPKTLTKYNGRLEKSIKLSCPAAVDLLFKSSNPLEFNLIEIKDKVVIISNNEDKKSNISFSNEGYFDLRSLAITILQYRDISIKERLYMLGKICYIIDNLVESKEYSSEEIQAYIRELGSTFKEDPTFKIKEEYNFNEDEKFELISKTLPLVDEFLKGANTRNKTKAFEPIRDKSIDVTKVTVSEIKNFKLNVLDKFLSDNQYVLEHYLVFKLFEEIFPKNSNSIMDSFNLILNKLLMLIVFMTIIYKDYNGINIEEFKTMLYMFERQFNHSKLKEIILTNLNMHMHLDWDILLDIIL